MISPVSAPRVAGIAKYAKEHEWNLLIMDRLGYHPTAWKGDGVLATIRSDATSLKQIEKFIARGIPVVDLTISRPEVKVPRVMSDHSEIGRLAARYFIERRYRNFAWFSTSWGNVHRLRYDAFAAECPTRPLRLVCDEALKREKASEWNDVVKWLGGEFAKRELPLAVVTYDETDAARLLYAAKELGLKVPEELSILSIGNDPIICENQETPLSSIDQDLFRGGYEAAATLDRLMSGRGRPPKRGAVTLVPPIGVVERRSTQAVAIADPFVRKAVEFIGSHLAEPIGSPQIAEAIGIGRKRLDELFRTEFQHSLAEEIRSIRFARVKRLLRATDRPIGDIARECGFCTPSHLTNAFRDAFGLTPKAWRSGE